MRSSEPSATQMPPPSKAGKACRLCLRCQSQTTFKSTYLGRPNTDVFHDLVAEKGTLAAILPGSLSWASAVCRLLFPLLADLVDETFREIFKSAKHQVGAAA